MGDNLQNSASLASSSQTGFREVKQSANQAASASVSSCKPVSATASCEKKFSREETEARLTDLINNHRKDGCSELESLAKALEDKDMQACAEVGDIVDSLSIKHWKALDGDWYKKAWARIKERKSKGSSEINAYDPPIIMGTDPKKPNSGLDPLIDDTTYNQFGHIFAYIRYDYLWGDTVASLANDFHDPPAEWSPIIPFAKNDISKEDFVAGLRGISIGKRLREGKICLGDLPNILREELGPFEDNKQLRDEAEKDREQIMIWRQEENEDEDESLFPLY